MKKNSSYILIGMLILAVVLSGCGGGGGSRISSGDGGTERLDYTIDGVTFYLRNVPGGLTFPTDSSPNSFLDNTTATVPNEYWIGETEVTYALWYKVYAWAVDHGYTFEHYGREGSSGSKTPDTSHTPTLPPAPTAAKLEPVTTISWRDAIVWCNALSEMAGLEPVYKKGLGVLKDSTNTGDCDGVSAPTTGDKGFRLPTSNEWELAARYQGSDSSNGAIPMGSLYWTPGTYASGATEYSYNSSGANPNQNPTIAVAVYNTSKTASVMSKNANDLYLYDMSGNVWEWCFDLFTSTERVTRGGSWNYAADDQRLGYVYENEPATFGSILGFRLARTR